jgi:GT2 family glycosyltransferase
MWIQPVNPRAPVTWDECVNREHVVAEFHCGKHAQTEDPPIPGRPLRRGCCIIVCTIKRADSVVRFLDSLAGSDHFCEQLIVVDASPDDLTERAIRAYPALDRLAGGVDYLRVSGPLVGLTRQRNTALRWVRTDLVAFFDDDVVLLPGCLAHMERVQRESDGSIVGVGAYIVNEHCPPSALWRLRLRLRIVPTLRPGSYARSGISVPWWFLAPTDAVVEGDWLPGGATMWRTADAREVLFAEQLEGYANGEDLEFSLLMRSRGSIVVAGSARLLHMHCELARPSDYQMGYVGIRNAFHIHQVCLGGRRRRDRAYFMYAYGLDTVIRLAGLVKPGKVKERWQFLRGRLAFLLKLVLQ